MNGLFRQHEIRLDHLVVAAPTLESGAQWLSAHLGAPLAGGGRHQGWGTHNRLLQLGGGTYLELIAPDPEQPAPQRPRPFGLDTEVMREWIATRPRLVHYVVRARGIEAAVAALPWQPGTVTTMTRGALAWRITAGAAFAAPVGVLPTLIEWDTDAHPATTLPQSGVTLHRLRITAPATSLAMLSELQEDARIELVRTGSAHAQPSLAAELDTPAGRMTID